MATTPTLPAAPAAAPTAPAAAPAAAPTSTAGLSDEQILELDSPAPAQPDAPAEPAKPADAEPAKPAADAPDLAHIPEKYRADADLVKIFNEHKAWGDLGAKIEDIKALREALPEGLKQIEELRTIQRETQEQDAAWYSKDPQQQRASLESIYANDPEAFASGFRVSSQLLAERNPQAYAQVAGDLVRGTLTQAGFDQFAEAARKAVQSGDSEAQGELLNEMLGWMERNAKVGLSAEQRLANHQRDSQQQAQSRLEEQVATERRGLETFNTEMSRQAQEQVTAAVTETLGKLLPKEFPAAMRARIAKEIQEGVDKAARENPDVQKRVQELYGALIPPGYNAQGHKGAIGLRLTPQHQKAIADFIAGHSKGLIAATAEKILPEWTANFMAAQTNKTEKADAAASRADVQSGGAAPALKPANASDQVRAVEKERGRRLTDEEILDL